MPLEIKLYPFQQRALISTSNEILMGGAAGPGKSYGLRVIAILLALEIPGIQIYLFRRLFKELMLTHVHGPTGFNMLLKEMTAAGDVGFNKQEGVFTFYNGSQIFLCHAQYEDDVEIYLSTDIHVLLLDEATQFTEKMVRFLRTRVRLGGFSVPDKWRPMLPRIIYATNPGGTSHRYFRYGFVVFGAGVQHQAPEHDGGMMREYVPARYTDNIVMMRNDPSYAARLSGIGDPNLVKAYRDGAWDLNVDGPFAEVWDAEKHIITNITVPPTWRLDRSHDYGESAPAATLYTVEANGENCLINGTEIAVPRRSLILIGEKYFADKEGKGLKLPPREMAKRMKAYEESVGFWGRVQPGPADSSIFDKRPGHAAIHDSFEEEKITFVKADKSPGSRRRGLTLMKQMLSAAKERLYDQPWLLIHANCENTIRTLVELPTDPNDSDDVDSSSEDHCYDAVRYRVLRTASRAAMSRFGGS